jgi:phosphoglycolate phosphatase
MRLCAFDLDHTLIDTSLDLAAMARDMRACLEEARGPLPPREDRWRVGELLAWCRAEAPELLEAAWGIALAHEAPAMAAARLQPGAREALAGARDAGFATALWTNNARSLTLPVLERLGLAADLDLVVTRDDMRALKPDPDGWRVIAGRFGRVDDAVVVGDSWVDGAAAAAAGVAFVAFRARPTELLRWNVRPVAHLTELGALPAWLAARTHGGRA